MIRRKIAFILLLYYVLFLTMPYVPYLQYYYYRLSHSLEMQQVKKDGFTAKDNKILTGDISYLNALVKRAVDQEHHDHTPPPVPNMETIHIFYLPPGSLANLVRPLHFFRLSYLYQNIYNGIFCEISPPPPRILS